MAAVMPNESVPIIALFPYTPVLLHCFLRGAAMPGETRLNREFDTNRHVVGGLRPVTRVLQRDLLTQSGNKVV